METRTIEKTHGDSVTGQIRKPVNAGQEGPTVPILVLNVCDDLRCVDIKMPLQRGACCLPVSPEREKSSGLLLTLGSA